jgi:RNA polymerase sigma-70 factor (ECF subfamily)
LCWENERRRLSADFVPVRQPSPALLEQARAGDAAAFCELIREHEARVLRQALALCGDATLAEDLAQDTFVAAWKSIHRYDGRCRLFTWVCSILIHLHLNSRRKRRPVALASLTRSEADEARVFAENVIAADVSPDEVLHLGEREALFRRCVQRLPEKHREVIYLRFYVDQSLDAIAAALGCSVGTVKSRLFHALEKLAQMNELKRYASAKEVV